MVPAQRALSGHIKRITEDMSYTKIPPYRPRCAHVWLSVFVTNENDCMCVLVQTWISGTLASRQAKLIRVRLAQFFVNKETYSRYPSRRWCHVAPPCSVSPLSYTMLLYWSSTKTDRSLTALHSSIRRASHKDVQKTAPPSNARSARTPFCSKLRLSQRLVDLTGPQHVPIPSRLSRVPRPGVGLIGY